MAENELKQVAIRLMEQPPLYSEKPILTKDDAVDVMRNYLKDMDRELFCIINLNSRMMPINMNVVSMGSASETVVEMREVFKSAILSNAGNIMAFHNHPSGDATPSPQDLLVTKRMAAAAALMNIPLLDHIIIGAGENDHYSMREHGEIDNILQGMSMDDAIKETVQDMKAEYEVKEQNEKYDPYAKTKEFRKQVADNFIKGLSEEGLEWKKGWATKGPMRNGVSGKPYRGINQLALQAVSLMKGYDDPRWMTFKQIQNGENLHLSKGSKGVKVEYWFPVDRVEQKSVTYKEMYELIKSGEREREDFFMKPKYYVVFNGSCIEGLPELNIDRNYDVAPADAVNKISKGMGVPIFHDGGDSAFYRRITDSIHLPELSAFRDSEAFNAVALHELAHATGSEGRLNREMGDVFGDQAYAREELVAEITSAFMSFYTGVTAEDYDKANHQAYINSWIEMIDKSPEVLTSAVKDAEKAAEYMEYHLERQQDKAMDKKQTLSQEKAAELEF